MGRDNASFASILSIGSPPPVTSFVSAWLGSVSTPRAPPPFIGGVSLQSSKRRRMDDGHKDYGGHNAPSKDLVSPSYHTPAKKRRTEIGPIATPPSAPTANESPTPRPTRPIKAPSTLSLSSSQSSRRSSPTKSGARSLTKMEQLELADPEVVVGHALPPPAVRQLQQVFFENRALTGFVPNIPDVLAQFGLDEGVAPASLQVEKPTSTDQDFFNHALHIWRKVQYIGASALDEQNWYPYIHAILEWPLPPPSIAYPPEPLLSVIEAQNSLFDTSFIPKKSQEDDDPVDLAKHIGGVKVDHLLTFHAKHPQLRSTHDALRRLCYHRGWDEPPPYSPLLSLVLKRRFVAAVVEVKALAESDTSKALSQIVLATSAVLECMKRLRVGCDCERRCECREGWDEAEMLPAVGLMVDRTSWMLRIAYWETRGRIRITESVQVADMSTFEGVCRLLRLVEGIRSWAETTMLPFLIETMDLWKGKFDAKTRTAI